MGSCFVLTARGPGWGRPGQACVGVWEGASLVSHPGDWLTGLGDGWEGGPACPRPLGRTAAWHT